jgi:hypothetical protein
VAFERDNKGINRIRGYVRCLKCLEGCSSFGCSGGGGGKGERPCVMCDGGVDRGSDKFVAEALQGVVTSGFLNAECGCRWYRTGGLEVKRWLVRVRIRRCG